MVDLKIWQNCSEISLPLGISGISFKSSLKVLEGVGNKRGGGGLAGGVSGGGVGVSGNSCTVERGRQRKGCSLPLEIELSLVI